MPVLLLNDEKDCTSGSTMGVVIKSHVKCSKSCIQKGRDKTTTPKHPKTKKTRMERASFMYVNHSTHAACSYQLSSVPANNAKGKKRKHIPLTEIVSPANFHSVGLRILGAGVHTSRRSCQGSLCAHHNAGMLVYIGQRPHIIKKRGPKWGS